MVKYKNEFNALSWKQTGIFRWFYIDVGLNSKSKCYKATLCFSCTRGKTSNNSGSTVHAGPVWH